MSSINCDSCKAYIGSTYIRYSKRLGGGQALGAVCPKCGAVVSIKKAMPSDGPLSAPHDLLNDVEIGHLRFAAWRAHGDIRLQQRSDEE